ncbi:oxygenase MpaB family protein [Streptomyces albulus]|nr:oxygenase MpaB family protein [Streptomyces noursei]
MVGAGVSDHSTFRTEPWQRLLRTVGSLGTVIYGDRPRPPPRPDG